MSGECQTRCKTSHINTQKSVVIVVICRTLFFLHLLSRRQKKTNKKKKNPQQIFKSERGSWYFCLRNRGVGGPWRCRLALCRPTYSEVHRAISIPSPPQCVFWIDRGGQDTNGASSEGFLWDWSENGTLRAPHDVSTWPSTPGPCSIQQVSLVFRLSANNFLSEVHSDQLLTKKEEPCFWFQSSLLTKLSQLCCFTLCMKLEVSTICSFVTKICEFNATDLFLLQHI